MNVLKEKMIAYIGKLSSNKFLLTLRDAFVLVSALPLIAGFATMISSVFLDPNGIIFGEQGLHLGALFTGSQEMFMQSGFAQGLQTAQSIFSYFAQGTISINGLLICIAFAYMLSKRYYRKNKEPIITVFYALAAFFICIPWSFTTMIDGSEVVVNGFANSSFLGISGIFSALLISGITVWLYNTLLNKGFKIKMPASVPPAVAKSFESLIPGTLTISVFILATVLCVQFTGKTIPEEMLSLLQEPALAISKTGAFAFISQFTWSLFMWLGIHPSSIWGAIFGMTWDIAANENVAGLAHNLYSTMFMNYSTIAAGTFALAPVLALLIFSKSAHSKSVSKVALMPAVFNISEPITFGLPIVLNPIYLIPFVIVQPLCFYLAVFMTKIGFIPIVCNNVPWTVPPIISGILFTGTLTGGIVQLINLGVATAIYIPFVKIADRLEAKKEEQRMEKETEKEVKKAEKKMIEKAEEGNI
ncbi:PTS system, lactose/cellobiose family IIC component [Firmicutes bacterium M10-2]|nr:PTS system, lactose/cellobiose family IIC component [Firmicutes bacterium M10-2]